LLYAVHVATETAFQRKVLTQLAEINQKLDVIMTAQDDINAATSQIEADVAAENAATDAIKAEIANLEAQVAAGQAPDLTGLKAAVADLDAAAASEEGAVPPPPPAPSS
jgi:predicted  nucleic acid-binding Zn-ribbon protein